MISLLPLTKMFVIFAFIAVSLVGGTSSILKSMGIENYSDLKLYSMMSLLLEFLLIYILAAGWRYLWRVFPILNRVVYPDLNGRWNARIDWTWEDGAETKNGVKEGTVYIKQSLLSFSIDLETDESESSTLVVKPYKDIESSQPAIYYMYRSESKKPKSSNQQHKGAAIIKLNHESTRRMEGNYFTDRNTYGRYTFEKIV